MHVMDEATKAELVFDVRMALRQVPRGTFRDMGKPRLPGDEPPERIIAAASSTSIKRTWR